MQPDPTPAKPRYHAAYIPGGDDDPVIVAHCESYSQAMRVLTVRAMAHNNMGYGTPIVLLDLSSLPMNDETAFKRLLNDDPVISAIFKLGVSVGRSQP